MVQGRRPRLQDARRGHQRHLHRYVSRATGAAIAADDGADKKCPFTGNVSIRGRILTGKVVSTKMTRTLVIRRDHLHYIPEYSESLIRT